MSMRLRLAISLMLCCASAVAQQPGPSVVVPPSTPQFHTEAGGFYSALSRGYSDWRGVDVRIYRFSRRVSPFVFLASQTRDEGTQKNVTVGSYLIFNPRFYSIVSVSAAPKATAELYPRSRVDVMVFEKVASVPGLVLFAGVTAVYGVRATGGQIFSAGPMLYRGRAISTVTLRLNRDRRSGATSHSEMVEIQYGEQRKYWAGGSVSHGTEAYEVVAATPFDARFEGIGAAAFLQKWTSRNNGFIARYTFEHKYTAFVRHGIALSLFFDF